MRRGEYQSMREARYGGVCLQDARVERSGPPFGLRESGWVFDRALVVGVTSEGPEGRRVAAWVEGTFVYTTEGFGAISIVRVERPRWEHSDLELAPCDMEVGVHSPLSIVEVSDPPAL